jgi:hypothetical protein
MSSDIALRSLGVLVCLYAIAYFVTSMSVAALDAVSHKAGPTCGQMGCVSLASDRQSALGSNYEPVWMAAAFLPFD